MRAILQVPPRSVSHVYRDKSRSNRWHDEYAFTVRHINTVEIQRFRNEENAIQKRSWYIDKCKYRDLAAEEQALS